MEPDKSKRQIVSMIHQWWFLMFLHPHQTQTNMKIEKKKDTTLKYSKYFNEMTLHEPLFQNQSHSYSEEHWWYKRSWYCIDLCKLKADALIIVSNLIWLHKCVSCVWMFLYSCLLNWVLIAEENYFLLHVGRVQGQISTPPGNFTL